MPEIRDYLRNRVHSDEEYRHLVEQVEQTAERADRLEGIVANVEATTTASKTYAAGEYVNLNNVLYRVASAIASGGTITPGTNAIATTIMDEIRSLA